MNSPARTTKQTDPMLNRIVAGRYKLEARAGDALAQFIERNSFTSGRRKARTLAGDNA